MDLCLALFFPLFTSTEFAMPVYSQLPFIELVEFISVINLKVLFQFFNSRESHPGYEVTYMVLTTSIMVVAVNVCGKF